jgi:hypothetical protein
MKAAIPHQYDPGIEQRRRGRPKGTDYRGVDAVVHGKMRRLLEERKAPSLTAAAKLVVADAHGSGTPKSKITRLVRTYPFDR